MKYYKCIKESDTFNLKLGEYGYEVGDRVVAKVGDNYDVPLQYVTSVGSYNFHIYLEEVTKEEYDKGEEIVYPHELKYGLPKYYSINYNYGKETNAREALAKFNEIHNDKWEGSGSVYAFIGENGTAMPTNCSSTNERHEERIGRSIKMFTCTEYLQFFNNNNIDGLYPIY